MFELDAFVSFVAVLAGTLLMLAAVSGSFLQSASAYHAESGRLALLQASEALVATSEGAGLARYGQNSLRHHELDSEKIARVSGLSPETLALLIGLSGKARFAVSCSEPALAEPGAVRRLAYLDGEICVVELSRRE